MLYHLNNILLLILLIIDLIKPPIFLSSHGSLLLYYSRANNSKVAQWQTSEALVKSTQANSRFKHILAKSKVFSIFSNSKYHFFNMKIWFLKIVCNIFSSAEFSSIHETFREGTWSHLVSHSLILLKYCWSIAKSCVKHNLLTLHDAYIHVNFVLLACYLCIYNILYCNGEGNSQVTINGLAHLMWIASWSLRFLQLRMFV